MSNYCFSPPPLTCLKLSDRCRSRHTSGPSSGRRRRHHRRRLLKHPPNHVQTPISTSAIFKLSGDGLQIKLKSPSNSLQQIETKLNQFLDYGRESLDDLRTIVSVDGDNGRVAISCRRSTVEFLIALFLASLVTIIALRGLFKTRERVEEVFIYKRDRSLGGRDVVVGKSGANWLKGGTLTPLSSNDVNSYYMKRKYRKKTLGRKRNEELPQWWPRTVHCGSKETVHKEEYQTMVNQLIRAIMAHRMNGQDISANDVVQLRYLCKTYGVRTFLDTEFSENARDSLYRVSVNFVLEFSESIPHDATSIQINGENVREFIGGLADNIGLENVDAVRMVIAAVAARTRSRILQAWALEVQNKQAEALVELFKVCLIHLVFPPEENSPEMEMVAQSLAKFLSLEQREHILNSFTTVWGEDVHPSVVEALGLGRKETG